jgi:hypothetical protein
MDAVLPLDLTSRVYCLVLGGVLRHREASHCPS